MEMSLLPIPQIRDASAIKKELFFDNFEGRELAGKFEIDVESPRDLFLSLRYQYKEQKRLTKLRLNPNDISLAK